METPIRDGTWETQLAHNAKRCNVDLSQFGVYADWLEERNEGRACVTLIAGLRWCMRRSKYPLWRRQSRYMGTRWGWWFEDMRPPLVDDRHFGEGNLQTAHPHAFLPPLIRRALGVSQPYVYHPTLIDAITYAGYGVRILQQEADGQRYAIELAD